MFLREKTRSEFIENWESGLRRSFNVRGKAGGLIWTGKMNNNPGWVKQQGKDFEIRDSKNLWAQTVDALH